MSKHEAPQHRSDNQEFNNESAALDSTFEEYNVLPTNKHEQTDMTDPNNYANAIIARIKAEHAQSKLDSMQDSYKQTLDGVNKAVNDNISLDQQYKNDLAAFDAILGEYEVQKAAADTSAPAETEAPREFTAPSPADFKDTDVIPVVGEADLTNDEIDAWKQKVLAMNLNSEQREELLRKGPDNSDLNEKARPARKNNYGLTVEEFEETKKQSLVVDSAEDNHDEKFITSTLEFAGAIKPTKELASDLRSVFEEVKQAKAESNNSPRSSHAIAEALKDVASEAMNSEIDTVPIPTSPEARKKAELSYKKDAAKLRRKSRKSYKESFMNRLKNEKTQGIVEKYTRLDRAAAGAIIRSWNQFGSKQAKAHKQMNSFLNKNLLPKNR